MTTTFIGIDLAWQSDRNHTGIVVARGDDSGATAEVASAGISSLDGVVAFVKEDATANTVIAIDAPLIIRNQTGQRLCETEVSRRFGAYHAGAHSTNLTKYPDSPTCRLVQMLEAAGFAHEPRPHGSGKRDGRWFFEVYPHPAMVNLFRLDQIIRYKKGNASEKRQGLILLRNYMSALRAFDPPLRPGPEIEYLFHESVPQLRGRALKHYEDLLDAYFCSYLALFYWSFGAARNEMIGDLQSGTSWFLTEFLLRLTSEKGRRRSSTRCGSSSTRGGCTRCAIHAPAATRSCFDGCPTTFPKAAASRTPKRGIGSTVWVCSGSTLIRKISCAA